jgi:hypothetical protein
MKSLIEGERKMGKTIMIVDDEHPFHELYTAMLEDIE